MLRCSRRLHNKQQLNVKFGRRTLALPISRFKARAQSSLLASIATSRAVLPSTSRMLRPAPARKSASIHFTPASKFKVRDTNFLVKSVLTPHRKPERYTECLRKWNYERAVELSVVIAGTIRASRHATERSIAKGTRQYLRRSEHPTSNSLPSRHLACRRVCHSKGEDLRTLMAQHAWLRLPKWMG